MAAGWKVTPRRRPEDELGAGQFYSAASTYEKNVMRTIQRRILARALQLSPIPESSKVLDAGCGTGFGLELLIELGYDAQGIDSSKEMVAIAKKKGFGARVADIRALPFKHASFDAITSISAIQWLKTKDNYEKAAAEFFRVLKPKGSSAVIQFYPESEEEAVSAGRAFRRAGFRVVLHTDNADNPRKRKVFLLLTKE